MSPTAMIGTMVVKDVNNSISVNGKYVSSEIAFIVSQAALIASRSDALITQSLLERMIKETSPRTTLDMLKRYESMRMELEQIATARPRIGFLQD